eukprot:NODE_4192_length_828_cov_36.368046_g4034_i0.p1 GENE.NODE_4192_length_828_cov_36.368046_g4034_i0~~NODE_4192_length_828_cov_36.368046_g4034_i0.p1  ORF type:complete len:232 (-),score=56.33 NODE_4192_length_828_cov_36.368046_g4034_i0:87-782(-)
MASAHKNSKTTAFLPPPYFGCVEAQVWRCKIPSQCHFPYLKTLRLKTILCLSQEFSTRAFRSFLDQNSIQSINLGSQLWKPETDWSPFCEELFKAGLELLLTADTHPLLIMCGTGFHLTGMLVGLLRKAQGWCLNAILQEYKAFDSGRSECAAEWIEHFDLDLVAFDLSKAPNWFRDSLEWIAMEQRGEWPAAAPHTMYEQYYFPSSSFPLVSHKVQYDPKESLVGDDDDD